MPPGPIASGRGYVPKTVWGNLLNGGAVLTFTVVFSVATHDPAVLALGVLAILVTALNVSRIQRLKAQGIDPRQVGAGTGWGWTGAGRVAAFGQQGLTGPLPPYPPGAEPAYPTDAPAGTAAPFGPVPAVAGPAPIASPAARSSAADGPSVAPSSVPATATEGTAGWVEDPSGRHQARWYDGHAWTDQVADNGVLGRDLLG